MSAQDVKNRTAPGNESKDNRDVRSEFFKVYKREADEHDLVFLTKYADDLSNTMIFAGLLAAVSSTFITNVQSNLQPDNSATTAALLKLLIHTIDNTTFQGVDLTPPVWNGPDTNIVAVQVLLYLSLGGSLLAASLAMLGKQWVNRYVERKRGSLVEQCHDRQQKLDGINDWKFHTIMECLPLMLQFAVLLLGISLSQFMWGICSAVAVAIIGVTSFGILFYVFIVVSATLFSYCPFQTPLSIFLRPVMISVKSSPLWFDSRAHSYFQSISDFVSFHMNRRPIKFFLRSSAPELRSAGRDVHRIFDDKDFDFDSNRLDARCVMWLHGASTDPDVAITVLDFISEVQWDANVDVTPSIPVLARELQEYGQLVSSCPAVIQTSQDKAYATAKAFLTLYVQRSLHHEFDTSLVEEFDFPFHYFPQGNSLQSTLMMVNNIVVTGKRGRWSFTPGDVLSVPRIAWLSRLLLYQMSIPNGCQYNIRFLNIILKQFQTWSGDLPVHVIADCLLIYGLTLGMRVDVRDLPVTDKGRKISIIIKNLYEQIRVVFEENTTWRQHNPEQVLRPLQFLSRWKFGLEDEKYITANTNTDLCQNILDSKVNDGCKWDAVRLVMQIGFRYRLRDTYVPFAKSPSKVCVTFLEHHFVNDPNNHDTIADAFHALCIYCRRIDSDPSITYALSEEIFVRGICSALEDPTQTRLHRVVLRFVCHIVHTIGDPANVVIQKVFIKLGFSAALKAGWESVVLTYGDPDYDCTRTYLSILGGLSRSQIWHPYLLRDHWETFEYATRNDQYWLGHKLLRGNYARKYFGWKGLAEYILIAWKSNLHPIGYLQYFKFDSKLVLDTINLLVMRGKPSRGLVEAVLAMTQAVEVKQKKMWTKHTALQLTVLKELMKLSDDVETHGPNGWRDVVISSARKRKDTKRMRRRQNELHYLNVDHHLS